MAALYHSLFTELGLELLRESIQNGTKLGITHMSFGDGGGNLPIPDATYTQLINEVYRVQLNRLAPSKENPNWLEADGVIPSAVGGFNIREVGLWAGDVMVAYANYPPTYKPSGDQGTAQIKTIRIVLQIDNTANFELKIDASVVMATIQSVEEAKLEAINHANDLAKIQLENVETINDLANIEKVNGKSVFVKGFEIGSSVGNGIFTYYEDQKNINDGGVIINGWCRNIGEFIYASYFNDDIIKAAKYAAQSGLKLVSLEKEYLVDEEFVLPENLVWLSNNSTIKQTGAASNSATASGIAPQSNVTIQGHLTIDMGAPTVGWGEKCHLRLDSFNNVTPKVRGFYFDTIKLKGGHFNSNGFVMAGGASLVRGKRIECDDTSVIGRVFMAHWGNFTQHYNDNGTYRHAENWQPTTHPHDCIIDEIVAGNLTCNTTDYSGIALVSAGYDIHIGSIRGNLLDSTISGKGLLFLTPGDLAFAYATDEEKARGMKNITVGNITGQTYALGIGLIESALYSAVDDYTNVPNPPSSNDYLAKISAVIDFMDCKGKVEVGNTSNILINGGNGLGSLYVKKAISQYFYSALYLRNLSDNVVIDELIVKDSKTNPVCIVGTGTNSTKLPKNTHIKRLVCERYGITSSNTIYRSAVRNEMAINTQIDEIVVTEHGNAYCVAASNNTMGYGFKVGSVIQNDPAYVSTFLINNANPVNDPIQIDNFIDKSGKVTAAVSGGVTTRQNGHIKEYITANFPTGLAVNFGDTITIRNPPAGGVYKYFVVTGGLVGTTAELQKTEARKTYLTQVESITIAPKSSMLVRKDGAISGLLMGDLLRFTYTKKLSGCFFYGDIYEDGKFHVYLNNPTDVSVTIDPGYIYIKQC
ncbi:phage tail protein [Acinetobacter baumannii]